MHISIIGAGNGGQAMAGHFALLGHQVTLYNRSEERLVPIIQNGGIQLMGSVNGFGKIRVITNDLKQAIENSNLIMITTTANAHKQLAKEIAQFAEEGQVFVLNPGRSLGAIEFSNNLRKNTKKKVFIAEAQSLIYACRSESNGKVKIIGVKDKVLLSAFPSVDTDHVINLVNAVYNCFLKVENVLVTSLENFGAILHPSVILFNAASIERGQLFYFYNDMTPTIANFLVVLDKERLAIGKAFGINLISITDWISYAYKNIQGDNLCNKMRNNPAYFEIQAPNTLHSRLLLEDVPTGILPFVELGRMAGVATPLLNSILQITSALLKSDFTKNGRSLQNLGLTNLSIEEFRKML